MADASSQDAPDLTRVSALKDASALVEKIEQIRRGRSQLEREWKMNVAFYRGNQWVWFNKFSGRVESLPQSDAGELPRWRVRLTSNQILSGVQAYIAMLTKTKPVISATPDSGSDRDIKSAQMGEQLFDNWWRDFSLKSKLQEALLWSALASAGYWKISWDPHAGKSMTFLVGPDGQPITNQELADAYRTELEREAQQRGLDPRQVIQQFEKTVFMGDIRVDVFGPHQVFLDPTATSFADASWVVCEHPMSPDEIRTRYGRTVEADSAVHDFTVPSSLGSKFSPGNGGEKTVKAVYIGYFKPSPALPKGRYVVFIKDPNEILYDGPWQLPVTELPLVEFAGPRVPGSTTNEALVTHSRPYQKLLNAVLSKIVEHVYLTIRPQMIAPMGSLRQRLTNEPGAVFEYAPVGAGSGGIVEPKWREMPNMPPYVFEFLREIQARMDRLFNLQAITRGDVPPNVEAGVAIDLLQEAAVDQVAPVIQGMEESLARAGNLMVKLAKTFYTEPRLLKIIGPGGIVKVKKFLNSDIDGGFSFHAEAGSGLPRTRAGRQARIEWLISQGIIRPDQAWKYLEIGDLKGLGALFAADEEQAQREQDRIVEGVPVNPLAVQQAVASLQQGINPETGQPLGPQDNPMLIVKRASLQPTDQENLTAHLDSHGLWMKSVEFETLPLQAQQDALMHYQLTRQRLLSLPQMAEPASPRVALQLKGTVDPQTAAQILQRSGVPEANPDNLSQPPLLTWESDDITKPETQNAGNQHLDATQQIQAMVHDEEQHQLKTAEAAHKVALAAAKVQEVKRRASQAARPPAKKAA